MQAAVRTPAKTLVAPTVKARPVRATTRPAVAQLDRVAMAARAAELRATGLTNSAVGAELGVSRETIRRLLGAAPAGVQEQVAA